MKICFVCNEYPPGPHGGIGTFTQVIARALYRAGHQVRVVGVYSKDYLAADYEVDNGVAVWRLSATSSHLQGLLLRYKLFKMVAKWAHGGEIDIVEVPDYQGMAAFWPKLPVPVVSRVHSSTTTSALQNFGVVSRRTLVFERSSLQRSDYWCAVSQHSLNAVTELFSMKPAYGVLYNPINIPNENSSKQRNCCDVVFAGTININKGVVSLINAWNKVAQVRPDARLHLYGKDGRLGDVSMLAHLKTLMDDAVVETVVFHGHVSRDLVFAALQTARLAIFPSYSEAFAMAPLEAMVHGCPTIYTNRASGPELVEDGVNGLLIDPDQPDQIAAAILQILEDNDLASRLGEAGRIAVRERYSLDVIHPKNEAFFGSCIREYKNGGILCP